MYLPNFAMYLPNFAMYLPNFAMYLPNFVMYLPNLVWTSYTNVRKNLTSPYTNMYIDCSMKSIASYMFRPPIVAIFRGVFS
jgi:hypothetical protein